MDISKPVDYLLMYKVTFLDTGAVLYFDCLESAKQFILYDETQQVKLEYPLYQNGGLIQ